LALLGLAVWGEGDGMAVRWGIGQKQALAKGGTMARALWMEYIPFHFDRIRC